MKKIAILGAYGFLGKPIISELKARDFEVVTFSRSDKNFSSNSNFKVDLFDIDTLRIALLNSRPDVVISTAWDTEHGKFWTSELNSKYKNATLNFAEICFELGATAFLGLGSMSEYGANPGACDALKTPLVPVDLYSKAKIETGVELELIGKAFNRKTNWLRVFQAFGQNEKPERFIPGLISTLKQGKPFSIRTPNYVMDWIHASDIASAVLFTLENNLNHFVDVGTGIPTSVKSFSELVCSELDLEPGLLDFSSQLPGHQKKAVVDSSAELLSLGWAPAESLKSRVRSLR
jgi:nucleoside-diphosphate-sugar epimerase